MKTYLLSAGTSNAKTAKNRLTSFILYLAPYTLSGSNVCAMASPGCVNACLFNAGMASAYPTVNAARLKKTMLWKNDPKTFYSMLGGELVGLNFEAGCKGEKYAIRLNGTSDLDHIERIKKYTGLDAIGLTNLIYYDYTKIIQRALKYRHTENYVITFSRSEKNESTVVEALQNNMVVSIVWRKTLPTHWNGYTVVDGDLSDIEMLEYRNKPIILGLTAKGTKAKKDTSGFVLD